MRGKIRFMLYGYNKCKIPKASLKNSKRNVNLKHIKKGDALSPLFETFNLQFIYKSL